MAKLLINVDNLCGREAVEARRGRPCVGADVFGVNEIADFQVGQLVRQRDGVEGVAGRAEDGRDLLGAFLERFDTIGNVVAQDA